jgi:hypothetical protein
MLRLITCSFVAIVVAGCGHGAGPPRDAAADRSAIVAALQQWPRDFNAKDLAVCALFEDDVVVAYPGGPEGGRVPAAARWQLEDPHLARILGARSSRHRRTLTAGTADTRLASADADGLVVISPH